MNFFKENRVYSIDLNHVRFQEFIDFAHDNKLITEVLKGKVFTVVLNEAQNAVTHLCIMENGKLLPGASPSSLINDIGGQHWFYRTDFHAEGQVFHDITYLYQYLVTEKVELTSTTAPKYIVVGFNKDGTKYTGPITSFLEKAEERAEKLSMDNPGSEYYVSVLKTKFMYSLIKTEV